MTDEGDQRLSAPPVSRMEYVYAGARPSALADVPGGPRPRRHLLRRGWAGAVLGTVAIVVIVVGPGLLACDWFVRNLEMNALLTSTEASEQAMDDSQHAVRLIIDGLARNGLPSDAALLEMESRLVNTAESAQVAIAAGGQSLADVRLLPWHGDIGAAQTAYLAHNLAWQAYLRAATADPTEFGRPQDRVNRTFETAAQAVSDAMPVPALFSLRDRVDAIFPVQPR